MQCGRTAGRMCTTEREREETAGGGIATSGGGDAGASEFRLRQAGASPPSGRGDECGGIRPKESSSTGEGLNEMSSTLRGDGGGAAGVAVVG
jgi:hypothetical protein